MMLSNTIFFWTENQKYLHTLTKPYTDVQGNNSLIRELVFFEEFMAEVELT